MFRIVFESFATHHATEIVCVSLILAGVVGAPCIDVHPADWVLHDGGRCVVCHLKDSFASYMLRDIDTLCAVKLVARSWSRVVEVGLTQPVRDLYTQIVVNENLA